MGDRISMSFRNEKESFCKESVVLFSHWGGRSFLKQAKTYINKLRKKISKNDISTPLSRLEPNTVMVDFIRHITKGFKGVDSDLYLGKSSDDGDNSDNGHFTIDVNTGRVKELEDWDTEPFID